MNERVVDKADAATARRHPRLLYHPLLFALYPIVFLFAQNVDEAELIDLYRALALAVAGLACVYAVARFLLRSAPKAAIVSSLAVAAVFAYGHVADPLRGLEISGYVIGRGALFVPLWTLLFVWLVYRVWRTRKDLTSLNQGLNVASLVLILMSALQIALYAARPHAVQTGSWARYARSYCEKLDLKKPNAPLPDIYFIVLDEYTRADVLKDVFDYDNSGFVAFLRSRGFYVADESHSHYMFTYASLASTLNMDYLQHLAVACGEEPGKRLCGDMIEDATVILLARQAGYRFYMLPSEFYVTNRNRNADVLFRRRNADMNEFERVLFGTTILRPLTGGMKNHRENRLFKLRTLAQMPSQPGPKFVFAHVIIPHPPYVFDRNGNPPARGLLDRTSYSISEIKGLYTGQVHYLNSRLEEIVLSIQKNSARPPVIIIQGDHGFRHAVRRSGGEVADLPYPQRSAILNAVYLPGTTSADFYPQLGPVNSFRMVFNRYLGANLELLPEETYEVDSAQQRYRIKKVACWAPRPAPRSTSRETAR